MDLENNVRIKNNNYTYKCKNSGLSNQTYNIGTITIDEYILAGNYINDNAGKYSGTLSTNSWATVSSARFDAYHYIYVVNTSVTANYDIESVWNGFVYRPTITLRKDLPYTGNENGSSTSAYTVG